MAGSVNGPKEFVAILAEHNFETRSKQLAALGCRLKALNLPAEELLQRVAALAPASASTFEEMSRLVVARGANAEGYSGRLLDHCSQSVRRAAVDSGLLTSAQAKEAFLSTESSRQLKTWLLRTRCLPCDDEVLTQAGHLFGNNAIWRVLTRTTDQQLFEKWVASFGKSMPSELTNLSAVARRFPDIIFQLMFDGKLSVHCKWSWVLALVEHHPQKVLHWYFAEASEQAGMLRSLEATLLSWSWRHAPEIMKEICCKNASASSPKFPLLKLVEVLPGIKSTDFGMTSNMKVALYVEIFSQLPQQHKTPQMALDFVKLFPTLKEHRGREIQNVIDAFWKVVAELGRLQRKEALQWSSFNLFRTFVAKLPPPLAVGQFLKLVSEVDATRDVYKFIQSDICATADGKHDELMKQVFDQYLLKEGEIAQQMITMFQVLLTDCKTMDVAQQAFESLTWRLGNETEHGLLLSVVSRMKTLQQSYSAKEGERKDGTLPIPVEWLHFTSLPKASEGDGVQPYIAYLHLTLHSGTGDGKLLAAMMARYGRVFFWDAFEEVLAAIGSTRDHKRKRQTLVSQQPPDLNVLAGIDVAPLETMKIAPRHGRPKMDMQGAGSAVGAKRKSLLGGGGAGGGYFECLEAAKKDTFGREADKRESGYLTMVSMAGKEKDDNNVFEDLLPFLAQRLNAEQDNIRANVMDKLLDGPGRALPLEMWASHLPSLQLLFKASTKTLNIEFEGPRHFQFQIWQRVGEELIKHEIKAWKDGQSETEACTFGLSCLEVILKGKTQALGLPTLFMRAGEGKLSFSETGLSVSAAKWIFEKALDTEPDLSGKLGNFWKFLETMGRGLDRAASLWKEWPFVSTTWRELLAGGVNQKAAELVTVGLVHTLLDMQKTEAIREEGKDGKLLFWWEPLETEAYQAAVQGVLAMIDAREIPSRDASRLLAERITALASKDYMVNYEAKTKPVLALRFSLPKGGNVPWHKREARQISWNAKVARDGASATREVEALRRVLAQSSGLERRSVLWRCVAAAQTIGGPTVGALLQDAIAGVDARSEGMACCIAKQYPYLEAALCAEQATHCEVLTPLLDAWMTDDDEKVVEERVKIIMARGDCQYFLFFGEKFPEFLSNRRQDWLHQCLLRLKAPSPEVAEFYHYTERMPSLARLALFGKGWRTSDNLHNPSQTFIKCVQTARWHQETQAEFLKKGLLTTDAATLSLLSRLDYVDGTARAAELLALFPKEQQGPPPDDGFVVVQPAGSCDDLAAEIERRFMEATSPGMRNGVSEPQVEMILTALGFADDAIHALRVLGEYAGKVKRAKDAVIRAVPNLSPAQSRVLVRDVMLGPKAGVSLCVAAVRQIADLQMPNPLELYKVAWRDGKCHRDIAGAILSRLATSPLVDGTPDDVRSFFEFFEIEARRPDHEYVANILLTDMKSTSKWSLPFLPGVVVKLAFIPGQAKGAAQALRLSVGHDTEAVVALTALLQHARFAARAKTVTSCGKSNSPASSVISDLAWVYNCSGEDFLLSVRDRSETCTPEALSRFIQELLQGCEGMTGAAKPQNIAELWARLLRPGEAAKWPQVVADMERWACSRGKLDNLRMVAQVVSQRAVAMKLEAEARVAMFAVVVPLFERILDQHLDKEALNKEGGTDLERSIARDILVLHWAPLLVNGCGREDSARLLARCPTFLSRPMGCSLIELSIQAKCPCSVAHDVLIWLATERREHPLTDLIHLGAKLVATGFPNAPCFQAVVDCLKPLTPDQSVLLVTSLLEMQPPRNIACEALRWLAKVSALDAVGLWPKVLTLKDTGGDEPNPQNKPAAEVVELLQLCMASNLELPLVPPRSCPVAAVPVLAASDLPAARVLAVQIIQERELAESSRETMKTLTGDPCPVVQFAAQLLWAALVDDTEEAAAAAAAAGAARRRESGGRRASGGGVATRIPAKTRTRAPRPTTTVRRRRAEPRR